MAIPDYKALLLPLLQYSGDGATHGYADACDSLAAQFQLSSDELSLRSQAVGAPVFRNRVGWAKTYLTKAKLIESRGRGTFSITLRRRDALNRCGGVLDVAFLRQFPEFLAFQNRTVPDSTIPQNGVADGGGTQPAYPERLTPDEQLEQAYAEINASLVQELLDGIKSSTSQFFEILVVDLLVAMGYGGSSRDAAQVVGRSGDAGIDGVIKQDHLGLDKVYVQAKKWDHGNRVSRADVQAFVGALEGQHASKGVFITTSVFADSARDYVRNLKSQVVLIDGEQLARYMIDFNVGVSLRLTYAVKKFDSDYFAEG